MKRSDVKILIASKKFVKHVSLKSISGIDYLVIGDTAQAVSSWQRAADQINKLEYAAETLPSEIILTREQLDSITDEQLAGLQPLTVGE